jgi:hypothetical protein
MIYLYFSHIDYLFIYLCLENRGSPLRDDIYKGRTELGLAEVHIQHMRSSAFSVALCAGPGA